MPAHVGSDEMERDGSNQIIRMRCKLKVSSSKHEYIHTYLVCVISASLLSAQNTAK